MRLMRAENPKGPYYDPKGNEAVKDIQKYALGLRVMDNYQNRRWERQDIYPVPYKDSTFRQLYIPHTPDIC